MTEKELRQLSRTQLLEILLEQSRELERVKRALDEQIQINENRLVQLKNVGNIAEAALALNGVFEAAQKAADQYIENIHALYGDGVPAGGYARSRELQYRDAYEEQYDSGYGTGAEEQAGYGEAYYEEQADPYGAYAEPEPAYEPPRKPSAGKNERRTSGRSERQRRSDDEGVNLEFVEI